MPLGHESALSAKHAQLENQIVLESQRPLPDSTALAHLKKEKLRVKEELARYAH
jgi:hypothetical protein